MKAIRMLLSTVALPIAIVVMARPAQAATTPYTDCVDKIIADCNEALSEASLWEKPIIGLACTALIAGCAVAP